jgi:hypothetical protein
MDENRDWNVETLRQYVLARIEAADKGYCQRFKSIEEMTTTIFNSQKEAVNAAMAASARADEKGDRAMEKRFDSVNEFRKLVEDYNKTTMPRGEVEVILKAHTARLDQMTMLISERQSQSAGSKSAWGYFVAGVAVVAALLAIFGRFGGP